MAGEALATLPSLAQSANTIGSTPMSLGQVTNSLSAMSAADQAALSASGAFDNVAAGSLGTNPTFWENAGNSLSGVGNFMTSDTGANLLGVGANLYGAYNANQLGKSQLALQQEQLRMNQDAYDRNIASEEARKKLNF